MPTYSYRCTECDNAFDIHQAFSDDSLTVCEVCSGKLRKVFNSIGVTFNGSGFYRTDSRSGGSSLPAAPAATSTGTSAPAAAASSASVSSGSSTQKSTAAPSS